MDAITDEANVLRYYPLGETGIILVACTAEHGLIHAVAKGARSSKNAFYGKIDLFFKISLTWRHTEGNGLSTLREIKLIDPREKIRQDYTRTAMGAYFTKLLEKGMERGTAAPEFHDLMERALNYLNTREPDLKALLHFERELVRLHGMENDRQPALQTLRQLLGTIPRQRDTILKLIPAPDRSPRQEE